MKLFSIWLRDAKSTPDTRYVDTCDGLRVLAVGLVAWFHIWQQSWLYPELNLFGHFISFDPVVRSGYIWVDFMILISGFCLYLPWARDERRTPDTLDFYAKRLARIHPSYLFAVLVMLAVALQTGAYYTKDALRVDLLSHLTYTHTFFYQAYYATNLGGTLWTLAIEMQFYLLFPIIARSFRKAGAQTFLAMVFLSVAFRFGVQLYAKDDSMFFNQLPAYLDTFAFGMAAAKLHVWLSKREHGPFVRIVCSLLTVVLFAALWQVVAAQSRSSGIPAIHVGQMNRRIVMGALGAALLIVSANAGLVVRRVLGNPLTRFLSSISFQFYIWHQTLAVWLVQYRVIPSQFEHPNYEGDLSWQIRFTAACVVGGLLLSALLTFALEKPAAKWLLAKWNALRHGEKA